MSSPAVSLVFEWESMVLLVIKDSGLERLHSRSSLLEHKDPSVYQYLATKVPVCRPFSVPAGLVQAPAGQGADSPGSRSPLPAVCSALPEDSVWEKKRIMSSVQFELNLQSKSKNHKAMRKKRCNILAENCA